MSLVRVWRRQLYGASTAALMVPTAMFAALIALALGGGFGSVGVLGQVFAGPSLPGGAGGLGVAASGGHRGNAGGGPRAVANSSLPVIPAVAPAGRTVPAVTHRGVGAGGGAIAAVGGAVRQGSGGSAGGQGSGGSAGGQGSAPVRNPAPAPAPASPAPQPSPPPQPTAVAKVMTVVTNVTQQVPAPAGPVATQVVQAAGSAAANLLPVGGQSVP